MSTATAPTVRLRIIRDDLGVIIIGGNYATSNVPIPHCACVAQAHYTATRGKPTPTDILDVTDYHGNPVAPSDWPTCGVDRSHWTWQHHGFTHRGA